MAKKRQKNKQSTQAERSQSTRVVTYEITDEPILDEAYRRLPKNVKEQLGLHQYQVRSWNAWHHHVALSMMALHFAMQTQVENQTEMPLLSVPDIKLVFAKTLLNKLDSFEGITRAINVRHQQRQADIDRFLK